MARATVVRMIVAGKATGPLRTIVARSATMACDTTAAWSRALITARTDTTTIAEHQAGSAVR